MRSSHHINKRQAACFASAAKLAEALGHPLNMSVTLNFAHTECPASDVSAAFERLRDNHFTRWLRYCLQSRHMHRGPPTYVWVIENSAHHTHVHWALHLPPSLRPDFKGKMPGWLEAVAGSLACEDSAIHIDDASNPAGLLKYLLKGIEPRLASKYGIKPRAQGIVHGKRCGVSKSLGPAALKLYKQQKGLPSPISLPRAAIA